jgi:uncharacterized protein
VRFAAAVPKWILAGGAVLAIAALPGVARLRTDNSPAAYFVRNAPELERYARFREDFGGDDSLRVVVRGPALWTAAGLRYASGLERRIGAVSGVRSAAGLVALFGGAGWDDEWTADAIARLRRRVAAEPLARGLGVVGATDETLTILVAFAGGTAEAQHALLFLLSREIQTAPHGLSAELVGLPVLDRALDRSAMEIYQRSFPLLVASAIVLLAATFRTVRAVLLPLLFVGFCEVVLFGAMGFAGVSLNLVLAILPPLLFVIALASAVHVLTRHRSLRESGVEGQAAVRATYRDKGAALAWTAASTFAGFGSLATSAVGPVRALGWWAMAGIALMALAAFTLLPALLLELGEGGARRRPIESGMERFGCRLAEAAVAKRRLVYALALLAAVLAAAGLPRLAVESNALHYLAAEHPVRQGFVALERAGVGTAAVELSLAAAPGTESFGNEDNLTKIAVLAERLRHDTANLGVVAVTDVLDAWSRRTAGPLAFGSAGARAPLLALLRLDPRGAAAISTFLTARGSETRITLFVPTVGYEQIDAISQQALRAAREIFPTATVGVTGQYPLLLETQKQLVSTLGQSFALTLVAVAGILYLLLRRVRLTLLALVPNVLPVVVIFGVMAWIGVPLDISTVMVASTTLGLALDDTIHTLVHYRRETLARNAAGAVLGAVEHNAAAYSITGLVLGLGFAVCAISSFAPIQRFGALSALAILLAVLADFLLVPALFGESAGPPTAAPAAAKRRSV